MGPKLIRRFVYSLLAFINAYWRFWSWNAITHAPQPALLESGVAVDVDGSLREPRNSCRGKSLEAESSARRE